MLNDIFVCKGGLDILLTDVPTEVHRIKTRITSSPSSRAALYHELGLDSWWTLWAWKYKYWRRAHSARAKLEMDELVRDGGPVELVERLPTGEELAEVLRQMRRELEESEEKERIVLEGRAHDQKSSLISVPTIHGLQDEAGGNQVQVKA